MIAPHEMNLRRIVKEDVLFEARGASEVLSQPPELCAVFACELVRPIISVLRRRIGGIAFSFSLMLKEGSSIFMLMRICVDDRCSRR